MNKKQRNAWLLEQRKLIRQAFFAAVQEMRSDVDYKALETAFKAGDLNAALRATHISRGQLADYANALDAAYTNSGTTTANAITGLRTPDGQSARIRFDVRDTNAEQQMRNYSSARVREITDDTLAGLRETLERALQRGVGPRTVATQIAGKINPLTGKREGGIIGLTRSQMANIDRARQQLLSSDPAELKKYLQRALRDKRFDTYVNKAIANGEPVDPSIVRKAMDAMENRALLNRAETIARTEALETLHAGQRAAFQQAIDEGKVHPDEIERRWDSSGDGRTRDSHEAMNGQTVGWNEPYTTPDGVQLMYPGDPAAPAEEIINCRCNETIRINYLKRIGR